MTSTSPISLGYVISEWRQYQRLTSAELARRAQVDRQYLYKLENDAIQDPGEDKITRISRALGLEMNDLAIRRLPGRPAESNTSVGSAIDYLLNTAPLSPIKRQQVSSQLISMTQGLVEVASASPEAVSGDQNWMHTPVSNRQ